MTVFWCPRHSEFHHISEIRQRLRNGAFLWCCLRGCLWTRVDQLPTRDGPRHSACLRNHLYSCCKHSWSRENVDTKCPYQTPSVSDLACLLSHRHTVDPGGGIRILPQEHERCPKPLEAGKRHVYWKKYEYPTPRIRSSLENSTDLQALLLNPEYRDCSTCQKYQSATSVNIGALRKHTASIHIGCAYGGHESDFHEHSLGYLRRFLIYAGTQLCCSDGLHYSDDGFSVGRCISPRECCFTQDRDGNPCSIYCNKSSRKRALTRE